jgi:hypothetical protein
MQNALVRPVVLPSFQPSIQGSMPCMQFAVPFCSRPLNLYALAFAAAEMTVQEDQQKALCRRLSSSCN